MLLTDWKIKSAQPGKKAQRLKDGGGLQLLIRPNGSKLWQYRYSYEKREKTLSFGPYPAITLSEARKQRDEARILLQRGLDPAAILSKDGTTGPESFESIAREWFAMEKKARWSDRHAGRVRSRLERDVYPIIGDRHIRSLKPVDVLNVVRKIEDRGALEMARRTHQHISAIFRYAVATDRADRDPCPDLRGALAPQPKVRHFASIKPNELDEFFEKLATYIGDEKTRLGILFVAYTFVRTVEARFARWSEFDLDAEAPMWRIPAERMKMDREHLVPLAPQVIEILSQIRKCSPESEFIFPGRGTKGVISENTWLYALYRMGYQGRMTIHGLRGTASTALNESGVFHPDAIERQLAHDEADKVRAAYNSAQYIRERIQMMHWYADFLDKKRLLAEMLA